MWTRVEVLLGFFATLAMVLLGAVWPSYLSLVALVVLPAVVLFLYTMVRPRALARNGVRIYLRYSVYASIACCVYYIIFILTQTSPA